MYRHIQEYLDGYERAADVLNGVHVEHGLAVHKAFTYHAAILLREIKDQSILVQR